MNRKLQEGGADADCQVPVAEMRLQRQLRIKLVAAVEQVRDPADDERAHGNRAGRVPSYGGFENSNSDPPLNLTLMPIYHLERGYQETCECHRIRSKGCKHFHAVDFSQEGVPHDDRKFIFFDRRNCLRHEAL